MGCSAYSTMDRTVVLLPPSKPGGLNSPSNDDNGSYTVSWNSVSTATRYQLQEKKNSGSWSTIHNGSARSKGLTGKGSGTYYYRVRACNSSGCSSYTSQVTTKVEFLPAIPSGLKAPRDVETYRQYSVSWKSVIRATRYELQKQYYRSSWKKIYEGSGLSISAKENMKRNRMYFRVRACNSAGCSAYSKSKRTSIYEYK